MNEENVFTHSTHLGVTTTDGTGSRKTRMKVWVLILSKFPVRWGYSCKEDYVNST